MKPVIATRSQIRDREWNHHISKSPQCAPYAFTFYLDIVCEDWQALVWPENGEYELVMPFAVRRRFGINIVYQPLFCQYLGVFSKNAVQPEHINAFIAALSNRFYYISAYHFSPDNYIHPHELNTGKHLRYQSAHTQLLPLNKRMEFRESYSKDRLNNLKRGLRVGWEMVGSKNIHPLIYLFNENHAAGIPGGVQHRAYETLDKLFNYLKEMNMADLLYAHLNGRIHAGILVVRSPGRSVFLFNAADKTGRSGNARTVLLDYYFLENQGEGIFDFESPEKKSVCDFYESFAAETVPFLCISKNSLPFPFRQLQNLRKQLMIRTS